MRREYRVKDLAAMKDSCYTLFQKTGGFIRGICHPKGRADLLLQMGLRWVRLDLPFPYGDNGSVTEAYRDFKASCRAYAQQGLSSIVVTPYPKAFIHHGIDVTTAYGLAEVSRICAWVAADFSAFKICWQATNEMHIPHFRAPLTAVQAKDFVIASITGLRRGNSSAAIGHNSVHYGWEALCHEIQRQAPGDYIGLDCYDGTWSEGGVDTYLEKIDLVYETLRMPVILMEFGFASQGGNRGISPQEANAYFESNGLASLEHALRSPALLKNVVPAKLGALFDAVAPVDLQECVLSCIQHLLKRWPYPGDIPHTETGQADFYARLLPKLLNHHAVGGAVIYCWQDSETCFLCGEADCPCETAWGLTRKDGRLKPAAAAVKQAFQQT